MSDIWGLEFTLWRESTIAMPPTIDIPDRGPMTLSSALDEERNVLNLASYGPAIKSLSQDLWEQRDSIASLVMHHLALGARDTCVVLPPEHWIRGGFNVCILV